MARSANSNYTVSGQAFDVFSSSPYGAVKAYDFPYLAKAVEQHDHSDTKGVGVLRVQTSSAPAAAGQVRVNSEDLQWYGTALQTAVRLADAQTLTGAKTFSGSGLRATLTNTNDGASSQVAIFEGDRATMAANDEAYLSLRLSDSAGNQDEFARLTWVGVDVTSASEDGRLEIDLPIAGTLTRVAYFEGRNLVIDQVTGDVTLAFSDPAASRTITFGDPGGNDSVVYLAATQTLTGKTLTSPVLTTPQINDTSADHQYIFAVSELAADRTVTLPLLAAADEFVFKDHAVTLTNKTLTTPTIGDFTNANHTHAAAGATGGTVDAGNLAGTVLKSTVVTSSLTAVGTIATGVWQGTAIADSYLATISTAGKVANSATTAASANTASAIVARDASGDFTAGTITAALTGNAATATALETARTINGTSFDGTANITVTAAAGTLTGTTLASGVTGSSLTSVGTLASLTVAGTHTFTAAGGSQWTLTDSFSAADNAFYVNPSTITLTGANPTTYGVARLFTLDNMALTATNAGQTVTDAVNFYSAAPVANASGGNTPTLSNTWAAWFQGAVKVATGGLTVSAGGIKSSDTTSWFLNDTANANMTTGLTIQGGASDNQHFCLKSSDVAHALVSGGTFAAETDDFFTIQKHSNASGGAWIQVMAADAAVSDICTLAAYGGTAQTTDTTASVGLVNIVVAEHNGANATIAMPADSNAFAIRASTGAGTTATRLLLKADDGELHLGNTTLVALDAEDDVMAVRGLQRARTGGRGIVATEYDAPAYSYDHLKRLGVVGEKDERGEFLIRVQPYLNLHDGAIWQLYTRLQAALAEISTLKRHVGLLPA